MSQDIPLKATPQERIASALERIANVQESLLKYTEQTRSEKSLMARKLEEAIKNRVNSEEK